MIKTKKLDNGMIEVSSDVALVSISEEPAEKIIVSSEDEVQYISKVTASQKDGVIH